LEETLIYPTALIFILIAFRLERAQFFIEALGEVTFKIEYFTEFEEAIDWFSKTTNYP
jgi:hypothetical protein